MKILLLLLFLAYFIECTHAACECLTSSNVNIRSTPCGTVIGSGSNGNCYKSTSKQQACTLNGVRYTFRSFQYGSGEGWVASNYLSSQPDSRCQGGCASIQIVSRAQWGARPPRTITNLNTPVGRMFIHHTAGGQCTTPSSCVSQVRSIQNYHMDSNKWADIGYNFLVGGDGRVYEGRGWKRVGAHTGCHNRYSLAICAIGTYTSTTPTPAMRNTIQNLIKCSVERGFLRSNYELFGHRDAMSTACPGNSLYNIIKGWPNYSTRPVRC